MPFGYCALRGLVSEYISEYKALGIRLNREIGVQIKLNPCEVIDSLLENVPHSPAQMYRSSCAKMSMIEEPFLNLTGNEALPKYDAGYHFVFTIDDGHKAHLEILEINRDILQAKFWTVCRPKLFSNKSKQLHTVMATHLAKRYGRGTPLSIAGVEYINYGDEITMCYLSKIRINFWDTLTVCVGNKAAWKK